MAFSSSSISVPAELKPASCQAERIHAALAKPITPTTMTREESQRKQLAYEVQRAAWRKLNGIKDTL
jgi:hypothetical protein